MDKERNPGSETPQSSNSRDQLQSEGSKGMKKSHSVSWSVDEPASSEPDTGSQLRPGKMRYSQLLKSLAGSMGGSEVSPAPGPHSTRTFDSSAQPSRPAMKQGSSGNSITRDPLYPSVMDSPTHAAVASGNQGTPINAATGVAYQTKGGAALASALGAQTIPPSCPPAPPTVTTGRATYPALLQQQQQQQQHQQFGGLPISNPSAVAVLGTGGSHVPQHSLDAPLESSPTAATADVTVQLSTLAGTGSIMAKPVLAGHGAPVDASMSRDQGTEEDWQQPLGPATSGPVLNQEDAVARWNTSHAAGAAVNAGGSGGGGGYDDDVASSGLIIPPGSQAPLPQFWSQLTLRGVLVGLLVGMGFALLTTRLALVTGFAPNLQIALAGGCWALLRLYTLLLGRDMACISCVTAQEVAVATSAALAVASSAAAGGFGTVLLALQEPLAQRVGSSVPGNLPSLVWTFQYWKLVCWLLMVGLGGALLMLPFRRALFARPSMTFATGAAAGQLLNTLHTPAMSYHGHKQMHRFTQWSVLSFIFSGYMWVFNNPACNGFTRFPTFGLQALKYTWNFDFELSYVGLGLIAPVSVAWSMIVGGIISWGLLWPVFSSKEGAWYPAGLPAWDTRGVYGYYLIAALSLLLADALYHMVRGIVVAVISWLPDSCDSSTASSCCAAGAAGGDAVDAVEAQFEMEQERSSELGPGLKKRRKKSKHAWRKEALRIIETDTLSDASALQFSLAAMERALRQHIFMVEGSLAPWIGILGFIVCMAAAVGGLPVLFRPETATLSGGGMSSAEGELRFYYVLIAALVAAVAALANARGAGVTDVNMADAYAKLGILLFAAWAGKGVAGVGTGLVCSGLLLGACTSALNALYAWRAGFMTMANPMAVFISHMVGLVVGCIFTPAAWLLYSDVAAAAGKSTAGGLLSASDGFFASPLASVFRSSAALATGGMSALPAHCLWVGLGALVVAFALNGVRDILPVQVRGLVPIPAAIGVVCLSGASVAVDIAVGAVARIVWRLRYPRSAEAYSLSVGTALITGPGLFAVAKGLLAAFAVQAPICMSFALAPAA